MSDKACSTEVSLTLDDVARDFSIWRSTRAHKERIPERLWGAVLSLLNSYPPSKVSQCLNLNYSEMKRRREEREGRSRDRETVSLVELGLPGFSANTQCASSRCQLEVETDDGLRFRCSVQGAIPDNLLLFIKSLRSGDR